MVLVLEGGSFLCAGESLVVLGVFRGGLCTATSWREGSRYMATVETGGKVCELRAGDYA